MEKVVEKACLFSRKYWNSIFFCILPVYFYFEDVDVDTQKRHSFIAQSRDEYEYANSMSQKLNFLI